MTQRKIPTIMGTQHPDNANAPFWDASQQPFISAYREMNDNANATEADIRQAVIDDLSRFLYRETARKPMILPMLIMV
ncbi:hypothetical protein GQS40_09790|uniref:Ribonuclease J C-terminal domain-containing protein n=1 Tax=Leuconostoc lactis TaxID=1246 RepID=A0A6L7A7A2_LEULA|nr:hypothetical protein [Leuconostoc lactis]